MKRLIALAAVLLIAAGLLTTLRTASAATNLIANPSAEQLGPDGGPIGWSGSTWGDSDASYELSQRAKEGAHALRTEIDGYRWGDAKWYFDHVPVAPSTEYTFSNSYRSNVRTYVTLDVLKTDGSHDYIGLGAVDPSGKRYAPFRVTFATPADAAKVTVLHSLASPGWLVTDDFSLTETGETPSTPTAPPETAPSTALPGSPSTEPPPTEPPPTEPPATTQPPATTPPPTAPAGAASYVSTAAVPESLLRYKRSSSIIWNRPLPASAPLDASSTGQAEVFGSHARAGGGLPNNWPGKFEDDENAPNVYVVDSDRVPFAPVRFQCPNGAQSWWNYDAAEFENYINNAYPGRYGVPIPSELVKSRSSSDTDSAVAIYDYKHDIQFNFWVFEGSNGNYTACWAGHSGGQYVGIKDPAKCNAMNAPDAFSKGDGTFCYPFGEDAAGFTDLGTNITIEEAKRGEINHAIAISVPQTRDDGFSYPATRNDGWCASQGVGAAIGGSQNCLYLGQRLRLPADYDTSTISNPFTRAVAEAAKTYGFVVHDSAGCMCIQSESAAALVAQGQPNPWDAIYGPGGNKGAYDAFPWEALQVVAKDYRW
jgi:hypothetical protein